MWMTKSFARAQPQNSKRYIDYLFILNREKRKCEWMGMWLGGLNRGLVSKRLLFFRQVSSVKWVRREWNARHSLSVYPRRNSICFFQWWEVLTMKLLISEFSIDDSRQHASNWTRKALFRHWNFVHKFLSKWPETSGIQLLQNICIYININSLFYS